MKYPEKHKLTDKEKELRDWLRDQPGGSKWWMVIKAGFRRSYDLGRADLQEVELGPCREALSDLMTEHRELVERVEALAAWYEDHGHMGWTRQAAKDVNALLSPTEVEPQGT